MHGYGPAPEEARRSLGQWLERGASAASRLEALDAARIRNVELGDGAIATCLRGVVTNGARLQRAVAALRLLLPRVAASGIAR